jgi:hypothetical protein
MTTKVGTTIIIESTAPDTCELCGKKAELRPYGPKGEFICVECGDRDPEGTWNRVLASMAKLREGATHAVSAEGEVLELGPPRNEQ